MAQAKVKEATPTDASAQKDDAVKDAVETSEARQHNEAFVNAVTRLSDESFGRIWDNPRDAEDDDL